MTSITLSAEQIRNAPVDIRHWIEREFLTSIAQRPKSEEVNKTHTAQLAACSEQDILAILSQIQGALPAVNVLFEFGRQGMSVGQPNIEAFSLLDIAHHTRLHNVAHVLSCLDLINQTTGRVRNDAAAQFCGFDREGHCFIRRETQQNISLVWQNVIANQQYELQTPLPLGPDVSEIGGNDAISQAGQQPTQGAGEGQAAE